jgi:tRNA nucleotidyltransferase (CCA-adding enzyme)
VIFCGVGARRFLLLRHSNGGHWAFPKGRIEPGEGEMTAALREVAEETGIGNLTVMEGFRAESQYSFERGGVPIEKTVVYFLGESPTTDVELSGEHAEAAWRESAEAHERLTFAESRRILDVVERHLEDRS